MDLIDLVLNLILIYVAAPFVGWAVFSWAGLLPCNVAGFASVAVTILLLRLTVLDLGLVPSYDGNDEDWD